MEEFYLYFRVFLIACNVF